jgi:hypothetical protein
VAPITVPPLGDAWTSRKLFEQRQRCGTTCAPSA